MPRRKLHDRPCRKELNLPTTIVQQVDEKLRDRFTGKAVHGGWTTLVTKLLEDWLTQNETITLTHSAKPFCATCLKDLPLTSPCTQETCTYEAIPG